MAVPADLTPTNYLGRVAFAENIQHPIFAGLDQQDFFTWSQDHVVYRNAYRKATHGAVSLAQCDQELGCSAIAECPVNDGLMLLCQMVVGRKLAGDPVAERLFDNMLAYCATYEPVRKDTDVVMDPDSPRGKLLAGSALQYDEAPGVLQAISDGKHQIVVFDATPENLKVLADNAAQVKAYTDAGGYLMAWGLTPDGLADFNRIVGVQHLLTPFEMERVTMPAQRDPLLSGLTGRDVAMESGQKIFPWQGDKYMVDDEFTYVVDFDDIAPFCELPGSTAGGHADPNDAAGWSRNMVNGFTSADAWKLIYYMSTASPRITMKLPREETITDIGIVLNQHYSKATRVNLYYDNDPEPVTLNTEISTERQDFALEPRKASSLTIELAGFDHPTPTTGIDNVWLTVARSPEWHAKVKPLLNIGGLVKYPMEQGGLVLCQLNIPEREAQPENAQKKRNIVTALLRNMGARFSGAKILVPGEGLAYAPVALSDHCNQYLTRDRGWFDNRYDLAALPVGENTFAGVRYLIRDFRTSPLPSCVMLSGQGVKGDMPAAVTGLPVRGRADSLFFLQGFKRTRDWRPPRQGDRTPPVLFRYVVHYADGTSADVPVRYGEGADNWIQDDPRGLKGAVVAWAAPFPNDTSGRQAVLYQMQWDNPRPDVAIQSVDRAYDESTNGQYGVPVLLAITAATRIE
jgi:beta-galactosidase